MDGDTFDARRRAAAHVFVASLEAPQPEAEDRHHLLRVLRLRPGESIAASDGVGGCRPCLLGADGELEPVGDIVRLPRAEPLITVAVAVPKGDRTEWAVQKLTELGIDRIVLLDTMRGVVRWEGERAGRHRARLSAVARAAAMQSRRVWWPEVVGPIPLRSLVAGSSASGPVALAEPGGETPSLGHPVIAVGPEGGWSPEELALDCPRVGLGPTVLRAETAAVVAGTLLGALRAGLVASMPARAARDRPAASDSRHSVCRPL